MTLPDLLQEALEDHLEGVSASVLRRFSDELSRVYRGGGSSKVIFDSELGWLAYLATRMPATFGAVHAVLREMKRRLPEWQGERLLDLGAGPGTASWAAIDLFPSLVKPVLLEQSPQAIQWGRKLAGCHSLLSHAEWIQGSLVDGAALPKADLAICSYSLTELSHPSLVIDKIWESGTPLMMVVEPGTPQGFKKIIAVREQWLRLGGFLVAPCPHALSCPMGPKDWCHFSARIARTKLHRLLKGADLGYEDEKFSYLIGSRVPVQKVSCRILRHPMKQKGHVQMVLCQESGKMENRTISRKDGELYRMARDAEWGDSM